MDQQLEKIKSRLDMERLPRHVAMIMDGNGRWARRQGFDRCIGHSEGVGTVNKVTELSSDLGIEYLTLYAFSTENWQRPQAEVETLMHLIGTTVENELPNMLRNNVRIHLLGDIDRIPEVPRRKLLGCREATSHCTGLNLSLCLSYSARWELTRAACILARRAAAGGLDPEGIDEKLFASCLDTAMTADIPDVDLLIRTGGEKRISNYLLWQIAYSELYFTDILWPDFDKEAYADALVDFQSRERRYGKTSDQVNS